MKNDLHQKIAKVFRKLLGFAILIFVSLGCLCGKSSENDNTATSNLVRTSKNSKETSPSYNSGNVAKSNEVIENKPFQEQLSAGFRIPDDNVGKRILSEYGAVNVARGGVTPPPTVMFNNENECSSWQSQLKISRESVGGFNIELQSPAMNSLKTAISEAQSQGLTITPRGADSARRSYGATVELWASRVNPALTYWVGKGRITQEDASRIKSLSPTAQVPEVLKLEDQGIYFSKDFSKSILQSVAAPGTSQHLSMLALDVSENENSKVREILAKNNWFQTVISDLPHFTYLGVTENDLPKLGLKRTSNGGRTFWIPAL